MLGGRGGGGGGGMQDKFESVLGKTCGPKICFVSVFVCVQNKEPFYFS